MLIDGRLHVPWISFANVPNGTSIETPSNLRFADFPSDYSRLPTVAFVIPNLDHDMRNGKPAGAQQPNAAGGGIDDKIITDVFVPVR
jgi:acid phosphatase